MASRLIWRGKEIEAKVRRASVVGINKTTGACIPTSKSLVKVKTGLLQGSIRLEPAQPTGSGARGEWGSFDVNYAIWQEVTSRGRPYLRPSADAHYHELPRHIKAAM